ncbi:hypothetical protein ABIC66_002379 [Caulobacter sp. 1776]
MSFARWSRLMDEALLVKVLRQLPVPLRTLWPQSLARL